MEENYNQYILSVFSRFKDLIYEKIPCDKTRESQVIGIIDSTHYNIQMSGSVYPLPFSESLLVGDKVMVCTPMNVKEKMFIVRKVVK